MQRQSLVRLHAAPGNDQGLHDLAAPGIGNAKHRAFRHVRVLEHGLLHFDRGNVIAG